MNDIAHGTYIIQEPNELETGYEYDMYVRGEYIGWRATREAAEQAIKEYMQETQNG